MIIVGELINASRKTVSIAIESHDTVAIQKLAKDQEDASATFIDVNAGAFGDDEVRIMKWLIHEVQAAVNIPCCIDSPNPLAIEAGLSATGGLAPMINSISLERARYEKILPLIAGSDVKVVALCTSEEGLPKTAESRLVIADKLITLLVKNKVKLENIYVDPLVQTVAANYLSGWEFLLSINEIMIRYQGVHTICGLSNVSYGLPERKFLNETFMVMAIARGLDAAIVNPLDKRMIASIIAAETLAGRDEFCMNYTKSYRGNNLKF